MGMFRSLLEPARVIDADPDSLAHNASLLVKVADRILRSRDWPSAGACREVSALTSAAEAKIALADYIQKYGQHATRQS